MQHIPQNDGKNGLSNAYKSEILQPFEIKNAIFFDKRNGTHVVTTILQLIVMLWNCGDTPVYTYGDSKLLVTIILNPKFCHHNSKV